MGSIEVYLTDIEGVINETRPEGGVDSEVKNDFAAWAQGESIGWPDGDWGEIGLFGKPMKVGDGL